MGTHDSWLGFAFFNQNHFRCPAMVSLMCKKKKMLIQQTISSQSFFPLFFSWNLLLFLWTLFCQRLMMCGNLVCLLTRKEGTTPRHTHIHTRKCSPYTVRLCVRSHNRNYIMRHYFLRLDSLSKPQMNQIKWIKMNQNLLTNQTKLFIGAVVLIL